MLASASAIVASAAARYAAKSADGRRQSARRRRVARRQFARRRARRQGQRERRAGCPRDECLGADVCHPTREPSRPAPPWPSYAVCCLRRTLVGAGQGAPPSPDLTSRRRAAGSAAARTSAYLRRNNGAPVIAEPPPEGPNVAEYSVSELASALRRTLEEFLRLHPVARRDLGVQEALLRPLLFRAQGRRRVSRCGVLAHHRAAPVVQAAGRPRGRRDRAGHDLSHPLQVPADRRSPGAGRHRRAHGPARAAQEAARGGRAVRHGAQAAGAVPARGHLAGNQIRRPGRSSATSCTVWPSAFRAASCYGRSRSRASSPRRRSRPRSGASMRCRRRVRCRARTC